MRFSLNATFLVLALAQILEIGLVNAYENDSPKRDLFKRISDGLRNSAFSHSADLVRDLRHTFEGLGGSYASRASLARRSTDDSKPFCVSKRHFVNQANTATNSSSTVSATGTTQASPSSTTSPATSPTSSPAQSNLRLVQSYSGNTFFSGWNFFTDSDPTHGLVKFVDGPTAQSSNLTSINSEGNAIMRVDTTPQVSGNRASVRLQTQFTFTGGLVIMDSVHMPTGCGTWPAFWTVGPNWPSGGEIDIVEGVNDYTNNQATLHTNVGCSLPNNVTKLDFSGSLVSGLNCAASQTGNAGCGVRASQTNSFGAPFNKDGGGVYAMLWDNSGISVWFFPRGSIPSDITASAPNPTNWGSPSSFWPANTCNPFENFKNHAAIFDTTLCGDWAGSVWAETGVPGQEQSCAQRTGFSTCEQFVKQNGAGLSEAYWEVKSVKIYQSK